MPLLTRAKDKVIRIRRSVAEKFKLKTDNGCEVRVVEEAPMLRTIVFRSFGSGRSTAYRIKTPWVYFLVVHSGFGTFNRACIFFSEVELKTRNQKGLGFAPLPNVFNKKIYKNPGTICFGRGVYNSDPKSLLRRFWKSRFTGEVSCEDSVVPASIEASSWGILARWAALTRRGIDLVGIRPVRDRALSSLEEIAEIISHS
jgi:hypothetical protein